MRRKEKEEKKYEEAMYRQGEYNKLNLQQKLARLDKRLGKGKGAKKERARLKKKGQ